MTEPGPLVLCPTEELIAELLARCDHGVVALMRCDEKPHETIVQIRRWKGNSETCIGIANRAIHAINHERDESERPYEDADERVLS